MSEQIFEPLSQTSYYLQAIKIDLEKKTHILASGTCFFMERNSKNYLITNWHNVTGKNPLTNEYLSSPFQSPDFLKVQVYKNQEILEPTHIDIPLKDEFGKKLWLEHPIHKQKVDAVAIEVTIPDDKFILHCETLIEPHNDKTQVKVKQDVFVLGYPFGIKTGDIFPIWKRASIASEPLIDVDELPKMYIDTASRSGMSGSPVIYMEKRNFGIIESETNDPNNIKSISHNHMQLVGIYSGRIGGKDELSAQLGIVWKFSALEEIIAKNCSQQGV